MPRLIGGEINLENMAARGEVFRSYLKPVLSAEQNGNQSEEINVIDESQAENRSVSVQEAAILLDAKTFLWSTILPICCA